ncbi:MAG: hypothetical protein HY903_14245 [Deltaproteobacteria bacterium]|nr:hypothetical protein [Deltaproteobacteria bacterium]
MLEFLAAGGFTMIPVLGFGLLTLALAGVFAARPSERRYGTVRALSAATLFATGSATAACFAAVMSKVPRTDAWAHSPDMPLLVMTGIGEALTPAIMGLALLTLTWLAVALGWRRLGAGDV